MTNEVDERTRDEVQPRPLWRNGDFRLLWGGQVVSVLGTQVSTLALPLLVLALTGSPAQAGLIAAAHFLPYVMVSLPAGALIDRWNRKAVMIGCDVARLLAFGSVPLAYALGHLTAAHLYVVALVEGTAFVFFNIAQSASLPRVVPAGQLLQANAATMAAMSVAAFLGPGLGGVLISFARTTVVGAAMAYLLDSLSYLASVISLAFIRIPFQVPRLPATQSSLSADIRDGVHFLWGQRLLRTLALLTLSTNIFLGPIDLAVIVLARDSLHADARAIGIIFSLGSVGALLGSVVAPRLRMRLRVGRIIVGATALEALALPVLATAASPLTLLVAWGFLTAAVSIYSVTVESYRLALTPDALQGRVNSVAGLLNFSCTPLGIAAGGLLLGRVGPRAELWLIALGMGSIVSVAAYSRLRRM